MIEWSFLCKLSLLTCITLEYYLKIYDEMYLIFIKIKEDHNS